MTQDYTARMTRKNGDSKEFSAATQARAVEAAMAWVTAEYDVITAAKRLLAQIAGEAREMLEGCNESGETARAFRDLEEAIRKAES